MTNQYTVEIQTAPGVWTAVKGFQRDTLTITRGRSDEQSQAQPQHMAFTLDNRTGDYSPRNPMSSLFGKIGRNTLVRCTIDNGTSTRFYGDISGLPPKWDESHSDNYIQVDANGSLRRLSQGQPPVSNALRDWVLAQSTLAAYYPLGGGGETNYSQNIAPGKTGSFTGSSGAAFSYGVDMGAAWLGSGLEINATGASAYMQGTANAVGSNVALDFVFQSLGLGVLDAEIWTSLDSYFNVRLNTSADDGTVQVWYETGSGPITTLPTAAIAALQDTAMHTCRFELHQVGPNVEYFVYIDGELVTPANDFNVTLARSPFFRLHYSRFTGQTYVNVAHFALWADNTAANLPDVQDYTDAAFAYQGETAIDRMTRIAADGDIPITIVGTAADSMPMGPQFTESRLDQIRDCESTDMGILLEQRDGAGLRYRSRTSLYNQTAAFTLAYNAGQVVAPLEPIDDDQTTRNDVTATKREGGSDRYTVDTGPLSTQDPPNGVGRYATDVQVNPETDGRLSDIAAWVANIGTLDEARWPQVTVNLQAAGMNSTLRAAIKAADVGDLFTITGMSKAFIFDNVNLIIIGYTETIDPFIHRITFNCMPADPYTVGVWSTSASSGTFRWDTGSSTLNSSATSTATSLSVATATGNALWTTDSAARPFDISVGGERMTVTNVTGSSSPQTFTVTRSVNGVVKAQASGTDVRLFDTPRWAL